MKTGITNHLLVRSFCNIIIFNFVLIFCFKFQLKAQENCLSYSYKVKQDKGYIIPNRQGYKELDSIVVQLQTHPNCKVAIENNRPITTEIGQQINWDEGNYVHEYLMKKGIAKDRFLIWYHANKPVQGLFVRSIENGEEGPSAVPPALPFVGNKKLIKLSQYKKFNHHH